MYCFHRVNLHKALRRLFQSYKTLLHALDMLVDDYSSLDNFIVLTAHSPVSISLIYQACCMSPLIICIILKRVYVVTSRLAFLCIMFGNTINTYRALLHSYVCMGITAKQIVALFQTLISVRGHEDRSFSVQLNLVI